MEEADQIIFMMDGRKGLLPADEEVASILRHYDKKTYTVDEFAKMVKDKYPDYADVDNNVLVDKMVNKYPQYKDSIKKIKVVDKIFSYFIIVYKVY